MSWRNIKLVWRRELQDQLRDRRTLFMVVVLPLLMYPLMGMSFFQLSHFMRGHEARVLVVGGDQLAANTELPPLIVDDQFALELFDSAADAHRMKVETVPGKTIPREAVKRLTSGKLDAIVVVPPKFSEKLGALRARIQAQRDAGEPKEEIQIPSPEVKYNLTREASQVAFMRVDRLLQKWQKQIVRKNLKDSGAPAGLAKAFQVVSQDISGGKGGMIGLWAKLLPFVVFVWALTGAFYPAVDLCAGEKERGTLETLLASPALRSEIVWGKLLTVTTFSMVTAVLNLAGLATTGHFVIKQLGAIGPAGMSAGMGMPPLSAILCLLASLVPIAALFGALSLACASFARSTKEGQYYFMPLFMGIMPLMLLPMSPGVELNLGNSLIPIMGLVLFLRSLLEGQYLAALPYFIPVTLVTFGCCLLAIKWAVSQFNQESVLFRESERFDLRLWFKKLVRNRQATPTGTVAVAGMAMIFVFQFFIQPIIASAGFKPGEGLLTFNVLASQACLLLPALLLTFWLARSPAKTLLLDRVPRFGHILGAIALAVAAHPVGVAMVNGIRWLYPLDEATLENAKAISELILPQSSPVWIPLLLVALIPAIVEELTFRGFMLSGLKRSAGPRWGVVLSAVMFGAAHTVFQQSVGAGILGLLLGYLAVTTCSLGPCIAFHATYNSLMVLSGYYAEQISNWLNQPGWQWLAVTDPDGNVTGYHPGVAIGGLLLGGLILAAMRQKPAREASVVTPSPATESAPAC